MSYQGGKQRLGKRIHDILDDVASNFENEDEKLPYFEPFVGYCGVIKHFGDERECYACDSNPSIIKMWKSIQRNWEPPKTYTKSMYYTLKGKSHSAEKGFIGCVCSYGGIFMGGWKGNDKGIKGGINSLMKIKPKIKKVNFLGSSCYTKFQPNNMLIYCDPPYENNTYGNVNKYFKFDHKEFWNVMRKWSKNNIVVISEYSAPKDFIKIWDVKMDIYAGLVKERTECLFIHNSLYKKVT
jgi:site-specific DNA-adenine methylase